MPGEFLNCRSDPRFVGDPIDVVTGANTDIITDLAQRGPLRFRWTRYYSSARAKTLCSLGWGHSHGFDCLLIRDLDGLRYEDPFGGAIGFQDPADGPDSVAGGMSLRRLGEHSYVVSQPGQPNREFHFSEGSDIARLSRLRRRRHTIELRYTNNRLLREIVDSRGRLIRVISDQAGRVLRLALADPKTGGERDILLAYEYDLAGNLIRATDVFKTTLTFAYDSSNRMTRRTDRRGYSFHFEYDDVGRCIHSRGDDGLLEVFLDYEPATQTTFVRRGDGGRWAYNYNERGTITQVIDPYGNATKYILDATGRTVEEIDPSGNVTQLHYDWLGQHDYLIDPNGHVLPTRAENPNPGDPLEYQLPKSPLQWDFGLLLDAEVIRLPQANDPLLVPFPAPVINTVLGQTATYDADAMKQREGYAGDILLDNDFGEPLERTAPRYTERWKYDANRNLVEHQDRDGSVFRWAYKSWNAQSQIIDPIGNAVAVEQNAQGLVAKVTDPGGTVVDYTYDLRDKLVEVHKNGRLEETYRRDRAGNVSQKLDDSGRTLVTWEVGPGNLDKVRILGSGEKHSFEYNANGRITKVQTPTGAVTLAYDEDSNLVADKRDGKGVAHEIELRQLVATTYFDKFKVTNETSDNGDLVVQDPTGARHRFQFGKTGLIVKNLANGSRELCQYNEDGRCRRKAVVRGKDSSLWMRGYNYSPTGDLLSVADTLRGMTKYRHDAAHRIVEEIPPDAAPRRFEHDASGNLVKQPGLTDVVVGDCNRLKEANGDLFNYNNRGLLVERKGLTRTVRYEYDDLDMLVRCDINGEPWTATYDGLCRRAQKTWRGQTTTYYWDDFRLAAEVRHDGSCRIYIYADGTALAPFLFIEYAGLDADPESGKRYYVFTNQVGAPTRVEDDSGRPCWSAQLDPYGQARVDPKSTIEMPLRFPGHYCDDESGLHYNRFRYYSPELGRYLQWDPAGQLGGFNLYAYVQNPLTRVDIDGLNDRGKGTRGGPKNQNPHVKPPPCHSSIDQEHLKDDDKLREEMKKRAHAMQLALMEAHEKGQTHIYLPDGTRLSTSPGARYPCLSLVVDRNTGKVSWGQNTGAVPKNPQPPLGDAINNRREEYPDKPGSRGSPGTHSEVHAMNQSLQDNPGSGPGDKAIYNIHSGTGDTDPTGKKEGEPMPCCKHCTPINGAHDPKEIGPGEKPPADSPAALAGVKRTKKDQEAFDEKMGRNTDGE
jgi:RHS repeat-associated protein